MKFHPPAACPPPPTPVASAIGAVLSPPDAPAESARAAQRLKRYTERSHPGCRKLKHVTDHISDREFWLLRYVSPLTGQRNCLVLFDGKAVQDFDAVPEARRLLKSIAAGCDPKLQNLSLGQYFDVVAMPRAIREHSKQYCKELVWRFNGYVRPHLGDRPMASITSAELQQLADNYRNGVHVGALGAPISDSTTNQVIALIKKVLRQAEETGVLTSNPARHLRLLRLDNIRQEVYSPEQIARILPALRAIDPRFAILFALLLLTGARIGELLATLSSDLDLEARTLNLRRTKSGRPMLMPLSTQAHALCVELKGMARAGNPHLFQARRGHGAMPPPRKQFKAVLAVLGIEDRTFHDARRTAITEAALNPEIGVLGASRMANHASTRITEDRYVSKRMASARKAVDAIGHLVEVDMVLGKAVRGEAPLQATR